MKLATKGGYELKDGVLSKTVSKKKHLLRMYDAWAVQKSVLEALPNETVVKITDKDDNKIYEATKADFWTKGVMLEWGKHGSQVALSRKDFTVV